MLAVGCQQTEADSPYTFEIDGRNVIINGQPLTPGGSSDELVDVLGIPDYAWAPDVPNNVFWKKYGVEAAAQNGCVVRIAVRISPVTEKDIKVWEREKYPGKRPQPRFPGKIILDSVEVTSDLSFEELNSKKHPPGFPDGFNVTDLLSSGHDPVRELKVEGENPYTLVLHLDHKSGELEFLEYYPMTQGRCQSRPLLNQEMLDSEEQA
ncbi:hypothetical protein BTA51_28205 [Hahella sp. CCB-MM4]|uniref:DUF7738 domain-containing protein n=1 Tax=Hahella sp. (strain CCB-MM4) TaxID=1926491 RepID=UPI000B9B0781|nr:hypothetical protein [Hahella sp. CCB-MM4]OZG70013.1 hypothetical protein BTA51_28205 [Hahella sp. CCB-MM4]